MMRSIFDEPETRKQWLYQSADDWQDGEITVTIREDGSALFEVEEEQAVDSYNAMFKCAAVLPPDKVRELGELLLESLRNVSEDEDNG